MGDTVALADFALLTSEYDAIAQQLRLLQQQYAQLQTERDRLNDQLRNCRTDPTEINRLRHEIDRLKDNISRLETEKTSLSNKNTQLEDRFLRCRSEAQFLNNVNTIDRMDIQRQIKEGIKHVEDEKEKINKLYIDCEIKSKDMQKGINEMEITISDLKIKNEALQGKVTNYEKNLNESDLIKSLNNEIDKLNNIIDKLKNKKKIKIKKIKKKI
jgi:predicted  nucleic acid-binding Zn-ribbon protein